jgi:hypothetical protein
MNQQPDVLTPADISNIKNLSYVKNLVTKMENPNPLIIVFIVICTILLCYFFYIEVIKINISGKWCDDDNNIYFIEHNNWSDHINIMQNGRNRQINNNGIVKGSVVILYDSISDTENIGVFLNNCIKWTNDTTWTLL